jgi:hypothetical protein
MEIEDYFSELQIVINDIKKDKELIIQKWLEKEKSKSSLQTFDNKQEVILKVFANKVLDHIFDIISKNKLAIFEIVSSIITYFIEKKFNIIYIYKIYSNLRNVTLLFYIEKYPELKDKIYYLLAELFDKNWIIFINEFLTTKCISFNDIKKEEKSDIKSNNKIKVSKIKTSAKSEQSKKDIRFTKRETISAMEFTKDLDYTVFDKVDILLKEIDDIIVLIYDLEDSQEPLKIIQSINKHLNEIPELLISLIVFEIIERAFTNLIEFLSTITEEMLKDKNKTSLLIDLLLALIKDFESWLKIIFIEKSSKDIHYFDASFRANILKIESIFNEEDNEDDEEDDENCEIDFF